MTSAATASTTEGQSADGSILIRPKEVPGEPCCYLHIGTCCCRGRHLQSPTGQASYACVALGQIGKRQACRVYAALARPGYRLSTLGTTWVGKSTH